MKKNILIVIPSLKLGGGAEKVATTVGSELYKLGYKINYFTFYDAINKYPFLGNEYCLTEKLEANVFLKIIKLFSRAIKITKYCKKNKITSIISHMEDANFPVILSKLFGNKAKINVVVHHSISDYGKGIYYRLIKFLYKRSDNIIVLTKFEKDKLVNDFGIKDEKILVIPNSVNIEQINKLKNENLGEFEKLFKNNKFTFITTGRLNRIKNQKLMINAFVKFNKKYGASQLIILGDGEEKQNLLKVANENVHFLGNQKNVFKFLNSSDCFLLTSISEAFPVSILEAMACGLPIISSKTQGGQEIIGSNEYGIIFENSNTKEFFYYIKKIYTENLLRNKFIKKSIEGSKEFDIRKIIKKREIIL